MARRKIGPSVHVIFETSCLFVEAADKLIRDEISEFILATNEGVEITVKWYIPQLVQAERKYQMKLHARRLIPHLDKVERLLGHNLGITGEILDGKVDAVIEREVQRHALVVRELDPQRVDWMAVVENAVTRRPPFDPAEKQEKGFRDAVILETISQLVEELPKTRQNCRIVLVCADHLLGEAAKQRTAERANFSIVSELSGLKTILNALASELTEKMLTEILPTASAVFLDSHKKTGLFYSDKIWEKIHERFGRILNELPSTGIISEPPSTGGTVGFVRLLVGEPAFLSKKAQTLRFSSAITVEVEAKRIVWRNVTPPWQSLPGLGTVLGATPPEDRLDLPALPLLIQHPD